MGTRDAHPRARLGASVALGAALSVAGCSSGVDRSKPVALPSPASSPTASPSPSPSSIEGAVRAAYVRYWDVLAQSHALRDHLSVKKLLANYVADPFLTYQLGYEDLRRKQHQVVEGRYVLHIKSIKATGDRKDSRAYVTDCQDARGVVIRNGQVPGSGVAVL